MNILAQTAARIGFGSGAVLGVWIENAILLRQAFFCAVRMVYPQLPKWLLRMAVRYDVTVITVYDAGHLQIDGVNPLNILSKERIKVAIRRLWSPLLNGANLFRLTVVMYRWIKLDRASKSASKTVRKCVVCAHTPNDQELSHAACDFRQPKTRSEN
jgi:hypothetical protein